VLKQNNQPNQQAYAYSADSYQGKGEAFFYGSDHSAVSIFRYPNANQLRGIGFHVHEKCDDIDLLVRGAAYFGKDPKSYQYFEAPCLVANFAGTPHSLIAPKKGSTLVYGFRAPFKGGKTLDEFDSSQVGAAPKPLVLDLRKGGLGVSTLYRSEYSSAERVSFYSRADVTPVACREWALVNLGGHSLRVIQDGHEWLIPGKGVFQSSSCTDLCFHSLEPTEESLVVLLYSLQSKGAVL